MKNTKRRNLALAVLGLALAALVVDHFTSAETDAPGTVAQAKAAGPVKAPSGVTLTLDKAPDMPCRPESLLACRLEDMTRSSKGEFRDVFQPSVQWIAPKASPAVRTEPDVVESDPAQVFQARHKLSAVLVNSGGGAAVISNTLMRVGQSLDGFRLNEIRRNAVTFTAPDGRSVVLSLDGANLES
ncbi:MAG: hypothetical protein NTV86_09105 [Planctomycetota bacterium]|nr:hypothetical protein [Planctomycetota bacterium]